MPRGDSVSRIQVILKGRCEVRVLKNRYAPIAYMSIVINNCYYQTLTADARVGTGIFYERLCRAIPICKFTKARILRGVMMDKTGTEM